jgi:3',5'-cyclic AMP phosphodiesterase CpdA
LFLDTLDEASHAGQMCERRLSWFARQLAETPSDRAILIFMHHPPFEVGVHAMDRIALAERAQFAEVVQPYQGRIRHLFFGHVHRPINGSWNGIPFSTLRGTNHQVAFDLDPSAPHFASHEPPAYAVALLNPGGVVVHTHDFLDASPRFPFSKPGVDDRVYQMGPIV